MKLLALDTATEACSIALKLDDEIVEHFELLPQRHSRELLRMIDNLLYSKKIKLSHLDALAFGCGPGTFTGLRVATAMIQGLAFAVNKPVVAVSTLQALAQQGLRVHKAKFVLSAIDARMGEVYWGAFKKIEELMISVIEEVVIAPNLVEQPAGEDNWIGMGTGWKFRHQLNVSVNQYCEDAYPRAIDIVVLAAVDFKNGLALPANKAMPVYLRNKIALKKK